MVEEGFGFGLCPSFSSYSNDGFSEAVARVTEGFDDADHCSVSGNGHSLISEEIKDECQKEDDFEFVLIRENEPAFPIFNHGVLENRLEREFSDRDSEGSRAIQISLEQLILGDRDHPSASSSEADEIPPGTYCMWTPKTVAVAEGRCKKSKSTGSSSSPSKRWRLLDLLRRSNSDGKRSAVFLTPSSRSSTKNEEKDEKLEQLGATKISGESKAAVKSNGKGASAHEVFYVHSRRLKEEEKKRSYLPYKQDLLGLWINLNASGKPFAPF